MRTSKAPEVQRTLDDLALQDAVGEVGETVGAERGGSVELAVDVINGDMLVVEFEALGAAGRDIGGGASGNGTC